MTINKRLRSLDKPTRGDAKHRHHLLRKQPRLSAFKDIGRDGKFLKPIAIEDRDCKHATAPTKLFRPHHQLNLIAEQARLSSRTRQRPTNLLTLFSPNSRPYSGPPELFDVSPDLPDVVPLTDGEKSSWNEEHAAFIKSAAGLSGSHWIGKRPLGSGGFGTAGLWERRDENNVVIQVMKRRDESSVQWLTKIEANCD